jgi:hypothetical protein
VDQEVAKTLGELELKLQELERELTSIGGRDTPAKPLHAPGKLIDEAVERDGDRRGKIDAEGSEEERAAADGDGFGGPPVFGGEELPAQAGATVERDWTVEARETAYGEIPTPPPSPSSPLPTPPVPPPAPMPQPPPATPPGPLPPASSPPGGPLPEVPTMRPSTPPGVHPPSTVRPPPPGFYQSPIRNPPPGLYQSPYSPDPQQPAAEEESHLIDLAALVRFRDKLASTMDALIAEYSQMLPADPPSRSRPDV